MAAQRGNNGQITSYHYDANGRLAQITDASGGTTQLGYDRRGNLIQRSDPLGQSTWFGYDPLNRLTSVVDPRGKTTSYVYDGLGLLRSQSSPDTGTFCHGDQPSIADICLVAQVANNQRYSLDMAPYPVISRINAACLELPAFRRAAPANQPDAE